MTRLLTNTEIIGRATEYKAERCPECCVSWNGHETRCKPEDLELVSSIRSIDQFCRTMRDFERVVSEIAELALSKGLISKEPHVYSKYVDLKDQTDSLSGMPGANSLFWKNELKIPMLENMWVSPCGNIIYGCDHEGHWNTADSIRLSFYLSSKGDPEQILEGKGFLKISREGPIDRYDKRTENPFKPTIFCGRELSQKQIDILFDYSKMYDVDIDELLT